MTNNPFDDPLESSISELEKSINSYEESFKNYITPDYKRRYLKNYSAYLTELENLERHVALYVVEKGISYANELKSSVDSGYSDALVGSLMNTDKEDFLNDLQTNSIIKQAIET